MIDGSFWGMYFSYWLIEVLKLLDAWLEALFVKCRSIEIDIKRERKSNVFAADSYCIRTRIFLSLLMAGVVVKCVRFYDQQ